MHSDVDTARNRQRSPRRVGACIDPSWRSMSRADAELHRNLGPVLGSYLEIKRARIALAGNTLVIGCRDRATALEIRFLLRDVRKTLDANGYAEVGNLRIVLDPAEPCGERGNEGRIREGVPASAVDALLSAAQSARDPRLAAALHRLARLGSRDPVTR